ncbi:MAG: RNA-processing protein [Thermoproteota archaeon]|nr:MAG: RNA-processing protein [Candidatus Korarchaeota archaeon]RLG55595.1 MAG: RNA-processing protein [Candidatus Korarchaeota archaeon]
MAEEELRIPIDRVGALVGASGWAKRLIEKTLGVKLKIDSNTGDVKITCEDESSAAVAMWKAKRVIEAIGLGFNPKKALLLAGDEYTLSVIDLSEYAPTKNSLIRIKGRIIGRKGKARENLERYTDTYISVYRDKIAIIGKIEDVKLAEKAIEMLIEGAEHSTVYKMLERESWRRKRDELLRKGGIPLW